MLTLFCDDLSSRNSSQIRYSGFLSSTVNFLQQIHKETWEAYATNSESFQTKHIMVFGITANVLRVCKYTSKEVKIENDLETSCKGLKFTV